MMIPLPLPLYFIYLFIFSCLILAPLSCQMSSLPQSGSTFPLYLPARLHRGFCVFVDLMLEQGTNLPLRQGEREAYWCFSYKSTSRKPRQRCCTASQRISDRARGAWRERWWEKRSGRDDVMEEGEDDKR